MFGKNKPKAAAIVRGRAFEPAPALAPPGPLVPDAARDLVVAIGASTGGTQALRYILARLPADLPPVVIVQHMPEAFTGPFAASLNQCSAMTVVECTAPIDLRPGLAVVARGGMHISVIKKAAGLAAAPEGGPPVCHQCPSVEVMFQSVLRAAGARSVGVILTGMGADGAHGLLALCRAGAATIAQNEETCAVFGMPREAIALGAARRILPLEQIPRAIVEAVEASRTAAYPPALT